MLTITKQSDYGLIFIEQLIRANSCVSLSEIITRTKLPKRFLARIAALLVKNQLVVSREGKSGGYQLSKKIKSINLYDYLRIFEGDLNFCSNDKSKYKRQRLLLQ